MDLGAWFGRGPKPPGEIAELRLAILEDVKNHIESTRGRQEFAWNYLVIDIFPHDAAQQTALRKVYVEEGRLEQEIKRALQSADCDFPLALKVEVNLTDDLPPGSGASRFAISYE